MKAVRKTLPWSVKIIELLIFVYVAYTLILAIMKIFQFLGGAQPADIASGPTTIYLAFGIGCIALPLAFICANFVSWSVPFLRTTNQNAFRGHQVSFKSANLDLVKFAYVSVPVGALALYIAVIEPWTLL